MIDVDKEAYFFFINLLLVLFHGPFQLVFFAAQQGEEYEYNAGECHYDATDCEPAGFIPGRKHY